MRLGERHLQISNLLYSNSLLNGNKRCQVSGVWVKQRKHRNLTDGGLVFAITHNCTGHPLVRHAHRLFASGEMGTVRQIIVEYLEAFANIYCGAVEAIRRHIDRNPMKPNEYKFPTVYDGLRGMQFICKAVESSDKGAVWVDLPN